MKPSFLFLAFLLAGCSSSAEPSGGSSGSGGSNAASDGGAAATGPGGGHAGGSDSGGSSGASGGAGGAGPILLGLFSPSFGSLNASIVAASGHGAAIENQRETWGTDFAQADEAFDIAHGVVPMISWALAYKKPSGHGNTCASYDKIMSGHYDDTWSDESGSHPGLKQEADTIKSFHVPVLIRFYKEFTDTADDACFYGTGHPATDPTKNGPMLVGIWQHVVDVFKAEGATNVQWVWGPSAGLFGNGAPDDKTWRYFYPGSNYVDWISNDNYNKSDNEIKAYADDTAIRNFYAITSKLGKPLMQAETGAGYNEKLHPDPMTAWITSAATTVKNDFPAMKAFVWWSAGGKFDYDLQGQGLEVFEQMAKDPYYQGSDVTPYATSAGGAGGPTPPSGVTASWSGSSVDVAWTASTDAFGTVSSYTIYRDGVVVGTSSMTSFVDSTAVAGSSHQYTVDAIDSVLNRSLPSASFKLED